jgi:hypothetical protein
MRKITQSSVIAFLSDSSFKSSNTNVVINNTTGVVRLILFGNCIAGKKIGEKSFTIRNCGYFTATTKERLNGLPNVRINQQNYSWFLNGELWNGNDETIQY